MSLRNLPVNVLRPLVRTLYSGPVKSLGDRFGLTSTLANTYWSLLYSISGNTLEREVGGVRTTFHTETRSAFVRFEDLAGEEPVIADLLSRLESDDVFFDIGANVGTYTCFAAALLPANQLFAFEPHPSNVEELHANLELNDRSARVLEYALFDENGELTLATSGDDAGAGTHSVSTADSDTAITVPGITGDDLIADGTTPAPTVLKIDVEGAEYQVLKGLAETLSSPDCRLVYCEVHPERMLEFGSEPVELEELLRQTGFEIERIFERDGEYFLRAT